MQTLFFALWFQRKPTQIWMPLDLHRPLDDVYVRWWVTKSNTRRSEGREAGRSADLWKRPPRLQATSSKMEIQADEKHISRRLQGLQVYFVSLLEVVKSYEQERCSIMKSVPTFSVAIYERNMKLIRPNLHLMMRKELITKTKKY